VKVADPDLHVTHGPEDSVAGRPEQPLTTISTHVLDVERGRPAEGIHVSLYKLGEDDRPIRITQALTDADGRVPDLLGRPLAPGVYRLEFNLAGGTWAETGDTSDGTGDGRFFRRLTVDLRVDDVRRSYHVPLLLAPYAMTTYRGS